jgi:Domain of unknown function (DUF6378)
MADVQDPKVPPTIAEALKGDKPGRFGSIHFTPGPDDPELVRTGLPDPVGTKHDVAEEVNEALTIPRDPTPSAKKDASPLDVAKKLVHGPRQGSYGHPFDDFSRTASMWAGYLGVNIKPEDVALMMIMVKISRLHNSPDHKDSLDDIAGYTETYHLVRQRREELDALRDFAEKNLARLRELTKDA